MMKKNKVIAASALALTITLAGGAALVGHAFAASNSTAVTLEATSQSTTKDISKGRGGGHGFRAKLDEAKIAELLGMTETDLRTELRAGKSLAAIAEGKGVAVQTVIDLVAEQMTANLDQKLEDGKVTQEQYDTAIAGVAEKAADYVNNTFVGKGDFGGRGGAKLDESAIAELFGMTSDEYVTAKEAGKSMAALAEEKGVTLQTVTDLVTEQLRTQLDKQLAEGNLTQEQYDARIADLAEKASKIVNSTHTGKGGHRGHGPKTADITDTAEATGTTTAV
jgi:predicted transcriptional regulator